MTRPKTLVAGGGGTLGAALCRAFAERGHEVVCAGRDRATLEAEVGATAGSLVEVELTSPESVRERLGAIGDVDVLVYNAGRIDLATLLETPPETFVASWQVNALGAFLCARAVVASMLARGHGSMVFVGATSSWRGSPRTPAFASAKHALRGLASALAKELGPRGVHVAHLVIDGKIWGPRTQRRFPDARQSDCLDPRAVAETICALTEQPPSAWTFELDLRPHTERWS